MSSIVDMMKNKNYFVCEQGASPEAIECAERALGLKFADDFRTYIQECGTASYEGHELTGISKDKNLDVVAVTNYNRPKNPNVNMPLYVIEETHMDGIVIWQAPDGTVYRTGIGTKPVKISENLADYIQLS